MSNLSFFGTGVAIEDMKPDGKELKVSLIDQLEVEGKLGSEVTNSTIVTDNSSTKRVLVGTEVDYVIALWEGEDNKITAPTIRKGEQVSVIRYKNQDVYYWSKSRGFETDLRGREVIVDGVSTIDRDKDENLGKSITEEDMYYMRKDSINGLIEIKTNMKNGEKAAYHMMFDGMNGKFFLIDDKKNTIDLDSVKEHLIVKTNKEITLEAPKVNIKCDEFNVDTKKTNFNSKTTVLKGSKFTDDTSSTTVTGTLTIKGTTTFKAAISGVGGKFKSIVKFMATGKAW